MPRYLYPGAVKASPTRTVVLQKFLGVDLTSSPIHVDIRRSPHAPNMMPDEDGYPSKRTGYETILKLEGCVYGIHALYLPNQKERILIHAGTCLYQAHEESDGAWRVTTIYQEMAQSKSCCVQLKEKLWILDGTTYLCYDGEKVTPVSQIATIPLITIAKGPKKDTGATAYKPINLLTGKRTDSFFGTKEDTEYYLSFSDLCDEKVKVEQLKESGTWEELTRGYTVDAALGKIIFETAPGESPLEGEDNVRITYEVKNQAKEINQSKIAILYGVAGAMNRVFVTGNPDRPHIDRWSEFEDPSYFADIDYSVLGSEACAIVGYSIVQNGLAAHKNGEENGRNIFIRTGVLNENAQAEFLLTDIVQSDRAIAQRSFQSAGGETLFLTERGICALASTNMTGERYAQNRSFFINRALLKENDLQSCDAIVWGKFYLLSVPESNRVYLLDTQQRTYDARQSSSGFQLECYVWEDVPAFCFWSNQKQLWFGTQDGRICRFLKGGQSRHYLDYDTTFQQAEFTKAGQAISASWTTPLMNLGTWSHLKTVTGTWIVGQPYTRSGGEIYFATDRTFQMNAKKYNIDIFNWNDIDFNRWTFHTMDTPMVVNARKKAKKIKLFQVKVENQRPSEPFGIFAIHIQFRITSKVKR